MSFVDGSFDGDDILVFWDHIEEIRWASPMKDSEKKREGWASWITVWDTAPLGAFQTEWEHGRELPTGGAR